MFLYPSGTVLLRVLMAAMYITICELYTTCADFHITSMSRCLMAVRLSSALSLIFPGLAKFSQSLNVYTSSCSTMPEYPQEADWREQMLVGFIWRKCLNARMFVEIGCGNMVILQTGLYKTPCAEYKGMEPENQTYATLKEHMMQALS